MSFENDINICIHDFISNKEVFLYSDLARALKKEFQFTDDIARLIIESELMFFDDYAQIGKDLWVKEVTIDWIIEIVDKQLNEDTTIDYSIFQREHRLKRNNINDILEYRQYEKYEQHNDVTDICDVFEPNHRKPLDKEQEKIDINTCAEEELTKLPGIGIALSKKALKIREEKKGFEDVDDFMLKVGIKPHIAERLRPFLKSSPYKTQESTFMGRRMIDY